jgi:hypothetical protein
MKARDASIPVCEYHFLGHSLQRSGDLILFDVYMQFSQQYMRPLDMA